MSGFEFGIVAAAFWSATNIIDKYLVGRFANEGGVGALLTLSALFPIVVLPIAYLATNQSIWLPIDQIGVLLLSGLLTVTWVYFYLRALESDDASIVMSLFQLTPLFALAFGYLLLAELPTTGQILFGAVIVLGSIVLAIDRISGSIKGTLLALVLTASALIALTNTLFKLVALSADFWTAIFWQGLGAVLTGLTIYCMHRPFRVSFHNFIAQNWGVGLTLNGINETLTITGNVIFAYAILLAPLAVVQTTEAYQPLFVFVFGSLMAMLFPRLIKEDLSRITLLQKTIGVAIVFIGSYFLVLA